jgi:hypothetical protein
MLVPKPKKAFQSPGAHKIGRKPAVDVVDVIARSSSWRACLDQPDPRRQTVDRRLPLLRSVPAGFCEIPSDCPDNPRKRRANHDNEPPAADWRGRKTMKIPRIQRGWSVLSAVCFRQSSAGRQGAAVGSLSSICRRIKQATKQRAAE